MNSFHVIAYKFFGEDKGEGIITRSSEQSHFLVVCKSEEDCIGLIKDSTGDREFDKYTIEKSEEILNRCVPADYSEHAPEQVFSL